MTMRRATIGLVVVAGFAMGFGPVGNVEGVVEPAVVEPIAPHDRPVIQLALLLDTSNSMDGLIDQARASLWAVVRELSAATHDGVAPELQVALIEYGNNGISRDAGYVRLRTNFTSDLDLLSEQLFGLVTNGGDEWCGRAIAEAMGTLRWWGDALSEGSGSSSLGEAALEALCEGLEGGVPKVIEVDGPVVRLLVIAGNEPFDQGATPYQSSIATARAMGVTVNTVHCGGRDEGLSTGWHDGARLGGGLFANIDSDRRVVEPATPFDAELSELNTKLNATYLPYGARGGVYVGRQLRQDALNDSAGFGAGRAASKAAPAYRQAHWDLVDAMEDGTVELSKLDDEDLPESLRGLGIEAQRAKIDAVRADRTRVQEAILAVTAKRDGFLAEWRERHAQGPDTLNDALIAALREQVVERGYAFEE